MNDKDKEIEYQKKTIKNLNKKIEKMEQNKKDLEGKYQSLKNHYSSLRNGEYFLGEQWNCKERKPIFQIEIMLKNTSKNGCCIGSVFSKAYTDDLLFAKTIELALKTQFNDVTVTANTNIKKDIYDEKNNDYLRV